MTRGCAAGSSRSSSSSLSAGCWPLARRLPDCSGRPTAGPPSSSTASSTSLRSALYAYGVSEVPRSRQRDLAGDSEVGTPATLSRYLKIVTNRKVLLFAPTWLAINAILGLWALQGPLLLTGNGQDSSQFLMRGISLIRHRPRLGRPGESSSEPASSSGVRSMRVSAGRPCSLSVSEPLQAWRSTCWRSTTSAVLRTCFGSVWAGRRGRVCSSLSGPPRRPSVSWPTSARVSRKIGAPLWVSTPSSWALARLSAPWSAASPHLEGDRRAARGHGRVARHRDRCPVEPAGARVDAYDRARACPPAARTGRSASRRAPACRTGTP